MVSTGGRIDRSPPTPNIRRAAAFMSSSNNMFLPGGTDSSHHPTTVPADATPVTYDELRNINLVLEKKEAELRLVTSKLSTILQNTSQAYLLVNRQYHITTFNPVAEKILRALVSREIREGESVFNFAPLTRLDLMKRSVDAAFRGECVRNETQIESAGGSRWLEFRYAPVRTNDTFVDAVLISFSDLTPQINARKELELNEVNLKALVENFDGYVWSMDRNYCYITFNSYLQTKLRENFGVEVRTGDRILSFLEQFRPEKAKELEGYYDLGLQGQPQRALIDLVSHGRTSYFELLLNPIVKHEEVIGLSCFARDVTTQIEDQQAHQAAQEEIRTSEALYRSLFHKSPLPKFIMARKTLKILEVNDTAVTHYGYTRQQFLSMTAFNLRVREEHTDLTRFLNKDQLTVSSDRQQVVRHRKQNGNIIFVQVAFHAITYKGEEAFLVLANDVTETLTLQKELAEQKVNRQIEITKATIYAQEKERTEVGKELHDNVNQMLATVKLYLEASMATNEINGALVSKATGLVVNCIEELRRISKSLVPPSLGDLTLREALEELVLTMRLTSKQVHLHVTGLNEDALNDDLKISIYRIVQEQLNNILKYAEATSIDIHVHQTDDKIELEVSDNGKGFELSQHRSGIGITNMMNRASVFNGSVRIDSSPGNGCCLSVDFLLR